MNGWLGAAGAISLATAGLHVFGGGPAINDPVQASTLPLLVRSVSEVVWHAITAILVINGLALLWGALDGRMVRLAWLVAVQYLAFAGLFVAYDISRFGSLMAMPQWILFLAMAFLAMLGLTRTA